MKRLSIALSMLVGLGALVCMPGLISFLIERCDAPPAAAVLVGVLIMVAVLVAGEWATGRASRRD